MNSVVDQNPQHVIGPAPGEWGLWVVLGVAVALAIVTVGLPAAAVVEGITRRLSSGGPVGLDGGGLGTGGLGTLLSTMAYTGGIGIVATSLAWPVAWVVCRGGSGKYAAAMTAMCAVPLLLPNYLVYAGLGLLRAPRTTLGDWLAGQEAWVSIGVMKAMAVVGLALWAWPLAVLVLAPAMRRLPRVTLEALELDASRRGWRWRRSAVVLSMLRGPAVAAAGVVGVVMLGSAVPLHVAQVETFATRLWLQLNLTGEPAAAWIGAWPLLVVAAIVAGAVCIRLGRGGDEIEGEAGGGENGSPEQGLAVLAAAAWGLSVVLPSALFVVNLREPMGAWSWETAWRMVAGFWRQSGEAAAGSAVTAGVVAVAGAGIAAVCWCAMSGVGRGRRRGAAASVALGCAGVWVLAALSPGVLIGSALTLVWGSAATGEVGAWVRDSAAILVLAHVARFGAVAALVGWWLASLETRAEREMRVLDGGGGVRGWRRTREWRGGLGAVVGAGVAMGALSLHEIEAAVMVQPPGMGSLAQQVLEDLHFARDARLSAAAVNLVGIGLVLALVAGWGIARAGRRGTERRIGARSRGVW